MNALHIAVLSSFGLLALSGASRILTAAPDLDLRPVARQCLTERRVYCAPDMIECHTERDFYWIPAVEKGITIDCPAIVDTIPRDIPPTPVFKCTDDAGEWYSWAPCDQEPDPVDA